MSEPSALNREVLSKFLPNHQAIRAFEKIISLVGQTLPDQIAALSTSVDDLGQSAAGANVKAEQALNLLAGIANSLDILANTPTPAPLLPSEIVLPSAEPIIPPEFFDVVRLREEFAALQQQVADLQVSPVQREQIIKLTGGVTGTGVNEIAATVATNANLTGPITSTGNATAVAAQTGTGSTFVMQASPTLTTPKSSTTIGVGNATPAATGAGISFPAAQSASSDANTLDDFEKGTWTPVLKDKPAEATIPAPTISGGIYTKIGNIVHIAGWWEASGEMTGTLTNGMQIQSLPFAVNSNSRVMCNIQPSALVNLTIPAGFMGFDFRATGSVTALDLYYFRSAANIAAFTANEMKDAAFVFYFHGFYFTTN